MDIFRRMTLDLKTYNFEDLNAIKEYFNTHKINKKQLFFILKKYLVDIDEVGQLNMEDMREFVFKNFPNIDVIVGHITALIKADTYVNYMQGVKEEMDKISPTFCTAKWLQSTILLYSGETHSCHHPPRHKIQPMDIKNNPKGIHNTEYKMKVREDLLNGIQTPECDYCWKIENMGKGYISDRIYKSASYWAYPHLKEVLESGRGKNIDPTYMEVAFDSTCNFKCIYCSPESSTKWQEEIKKYGSLKQSSFNLHDLNWLKDTGKLPIPQDEYNPYIESFWEAWPEFYKKLKTFRITGGEPLLSKHTWKLFDYVKNNTNKELALAINTNNNVPDNLIDRMIENINEMSPNLKYFDVYTSLESVGEQAEYSRDGINYKEFIDNCYKVLDNTPKSTRLNFMTTINLTSVPSMLDFLKLLKTMKDKYPLKRHESRVRTRLSYLRYPKSLMISLLSEEQKQYYGNIWLDYVDKNKYTDSETQKGSFYIEEVDQIKRLVDFMNMDKQPNSVYDDMRLYINQLDFRRDKDFKKVFPELTYLMDESYYG